MRRVAAALAGAVVAVASAGAAGASCAEPPPLRAALADARLAFVGTVVDAFNDDRWATVEVSEVWAGEAGARVEVRAGPADPPGPLEAASSIDRTFREGATYLFLPRQGPEPGVFHDDACSSTTAFTDRVAEHQPTVAAPPAGPSAPERGAPAPLWWAGAAAATALVLVLLRRRAAS